MRRGGERRWMHSAESWRNPSPATSSAGATVQLRTPSAQSSTVAAREPSMVPSTYSVAACAPSHLAARRESGALPSVRCSAGAPASIR